MYLFSKSKPKILRSFSAAWIPKHANTLKLSVPHLWLVGLFHTENLDMFSNGTRVNLLLNYVNMKRKPYAMLCDTKRELTEKYLQWISCLVTKLNPTVKMEIIFVIFS